MGHDYMNRRNNAEIEEANKADTEMFDKKLEERAKKTEREAAAKVAPIPGATIVNFLIKTNP